MLQIKSPTKKQLKVFVMGLCLIMLFLAGKYYRANKINLSLTFIALILILLILYLLKREFVIQFYKIWMRCASFMGIVVTGILMMVIFYLVFTPVGLFLRLLRKDLLNLKKDPKLNSYWIDKPQKEFDKHSYEKQF